MLNANQLGAVGLVIFAVASVASFLFGGTGHAFLPCCKPVDRHILAAAEPVDRSDINPAAEANRSAYPSLVKREIRLRSRSASPMIEGLHDYDERVVAVLSNEIARRGGLVWSDGQENTYVTADAGLLTELNDAAAAGVPGAEAFLRASFQKPDWSETRRAGAEFDTAAILFDSRHADWAYITMFVSGLPGTAIALFLAVVAMAITVDTRRPQPQNGTMRL